MSIEIRTERTTDKDGIEGYRILGIKGVLGVDELPAEYLEGKKIFYRAQGGAYLVGFHYNPRDPSICVWDEIEARVFKDIISGMCECADILARIRRRIKNIAEEWGNEKETWHI